MAIRTPDLERTSHRTARLYRASDRWRSQQRGEVERVAADAEFPWGAAATHAIPMFLVLTPLILLWARHELPEGQWVYNGLNGFIIAATLIVLVYAYFSNGSLGAGHVELWCTLLDATPTHPWDSSSGSARLLGLRSLLS